MPHLSCQPDTCANLQTNRAQLDAQNRQLQDIQAQMSDAPSANGGLYFVQNVLSWMFSWNYLDKARKKLIRPFSPEDNIVQIRNLTWTLHFLLPHQLQTTLLYQVLQRTFFINRTPASAEMAGWHVRNHSAAHLKNAGEC